MLRNDHGKMSVKWAYLTYLLFAEPLKRDIIASLPTHKHMGLVKEPQRSTSSNTFLFFSFL